MNEKDLIVFKTRLIEEKELIQKKISERHFDVEQKGDEIDEANALTQMSLLFRFNERDAMLIRKIDRALIKIENRTYGECESCGCEIEAKRLEARLTASLCLKCKEEEERIEKGFL